MLVLYDILARCELAMELRLNLLVLQVLKVLCMKPEELINFRFIHHAGRHLLFACDAHMPTFVTTS